MRYVILPRDVDMIQGELMTLKEFTDLEPGDVIRHKTDEIAFVVTGNYGSHVTAVRSVDATNECEWDLLAKVKPVKRVQPKLFTDSDRDA